MMNHPSGLGTALLSGISSLPHCCAGWDTGLKRYFLNSGKISDDERLRHEVYILNSILSSVAIP